MDRPTHVPILAYTFIGITSLVLAYATFLDKTPAKANALSSGAIASSTLPSIQSLNNTVATNVPPPPPPSESSENKQVQGGKTKRNKKKHTNTKRKTKSNSKS